MLISWGEQQAPFSSSPEKTPQKKSQILNMVAYN